MVAARGTRETVRPVVRGYATVASRNIHLDSQNPRHNPLERDAEIIAALCDQQLVALATDIAEMGALSPLEIVGAVDHEGQPGHYVAVEGNRRTCALLLLSDPSRAPTTELRDTFRQLAKESKIPSELHVFVFSDREAAQPWIDRRHLGEQGGVGAREWDNAAKARVAARSGVNTTAKADVLSLAVVERLVATGQLSPDQRGKISLTTLSRYLNSATRRSFLGLKGLDSDNRLVYTHEPSEVDGALLTIVLDSLPREDDKPRPVHSRSTAAERDAYVQELAGAGRIPTTRLPEPATLAEVRSDVAATSPRARSTANQANRNKLMVSGFTVKSTDKVLIRLRTELLQQPIEHHEFAANYLLRAFVERVLILYMQKDDPSRVHRTDQDLTQKCAIDAEKAGASRKIMNVLNQAASNSSVAHSLHTLGTAVHLGTVPVARQLVAVFDTWEPALRFMLDALSSGRK